MKRELCGQQGVKITGGSITASAKSHEQIWGEWQERVNMPTKTLEDFPNTEESQSVGETKGREKSTEHKSSRNNVAIKTHEQGRVERRSAGSYGYRYWLY